MKTKMSICYIIVLSLSLISAANGSNKVVMEYSFDRPVIEKVQVDKDIYTQITIPDAPNGGQIGYPALPGKSVRILLPYASESGDIDVSPGERVSLGKGHYLKPVCRPFIISEGPTTASLPQADSVIYSSASCYPNIRYEEVGLQKFRGYCILILKLYPVEYIPASGELFYYPKIKISVTTIPNQKSAQLFRGLQVDDRDIRHKIENPEILASYPAYADKNNGYDLLIVTIPEFTDSFQSLKDYHDTTGILTEIHTTAEIGGSTPDIVRDFIKSEYLNHGIEYVLIGADDDLIPARDLYVKSWEGGAEEYHMPGDVYFGCLDDSFNSDRDSLWGEETDGPGGENIDLTAEVYIGRAPAGNVTEAGHFVNKTIAYMSGQADFQDKVILAGEYLGFGGVGDYGGYSLDELENGSCEHGYTTVGIPAEDYQIDRLYDLNGFWMGTEMVDRINDGLNFIDHYGHSTTDRSLKISINMIETYFDNEFPIFIYSQGCLAGHFDGMDCWAEYATVKTAYVACAAVMNARYGFGAIYSTDGPSQRYNREFWDAVFNPGEGMAEIGKACQDSKEDNLYRIDEGCMRWCYYGINLLGDPTIKIKKVRTLAFNFNPELPGNLPAGENVELEVTVAGVGEGIPLAGTGQIHYAIDSSEFQIVPMTELETNHYRFQLPALECGSRMYYYFSAEEYFKGLIYDVDVNNAHKVIAGNDSATIFFDDFECDLGWTCSGEQWQRGYPTGAGGNSVSGPDPNAPYSALNEFGYNLYGNYEDNMDSVHLISPPINCFNKTVVKLSFWRCLGVEAPIYDHALISISTDAVNWQTVWENTSEVFDVDWVRKEYDISAWADHQPRIYLRWTMGPTDAAQTYCGWNIDDVLVSGFTCQINNCGDANADASVNLSDAVYIINYVFSGGDAPVPYDAGDVNCDGKCNVSDAVFIINYVFSGGKAPCDTNGDTVLDC